MDDWLVQIVQAVLKRALLDAHDDLQAALDALGAPGTAPVLASSPNVRVVQTSPDAATIEITGQQPLFGGAMMPMVRIRTVISRTAGTDGSIDIRDWQAVVGDLKIQRAPVFTGALAFGWESDHWTGRGALTIGPAGFGVDILLQALSDMGLALGITVKLPAPIPLGPTGLALIGVGGEFAYNFRPDAGPNPTALDYVRWARDRPQAWTAAPIDRTASGIGVNAGLGDVASNGFLLKLQPIGFLVLIPGPVFVFGGEGVLLDSGAVRAKGYVAVDAASESIALGLGVGVTYPPDPFTLIDAHGMLEAYYSFSQPSQWFIHVGTREAPIAARIGVPGLTFQGQAFLVMDRTGVALGIEIDVDEGFDVGVLAVWARAGVRVDAMMGWDPFQLEGWFRLWGELGLSILGLDFRLAAWAEAGGRVPHPTYVRFDVAVELDLPWPLPDFSGHVDVKLGEDPTPPPVAIPLRSAAPAAAGEPLKLAALHALTGRQWDLTGATRGVAAAAEQGLPWPDVDIVIPFNQPIRDDTHIVANPFPGTRNQGGYDVTHTVTAIELRNVSADGHPLVSPMHGVWAGAADGTTGRLHLLGTDPFAWLAPHTDVSRSVLFLQEGHREQRFGVGWDEGIFEARRFGDVVLRPDAPTYLDTQFMPAVPTLVVRSQRFAIDLSTADGKPIPVDELTLVVLAGPAERGGGLVFDVDVDGATGAVNVLPGAIPVYGDVGLALVQVPVPGEGRASFHVRSQHEGVPVYLVGLRYRPADRVRVFTGERTLLVPATYELTVRGESRATYAKADPSMPGPDEAPEPFTWTQTQRFDVVNPPSLRPYITTTTIGDPRIFGGASAWDPTPVGVGFPVYRRYRPVVRFRVSYLHRIFDPIRARIRYHDGQVVQHDASSRSALDGLSSLPRASNAWLAIHGVIPPADDELVVPDVLPPSGPATFSLAFPMPDGSGEIQLDEWAAYVSRFERFADHLRMAAAVTTFHGPDGTTVRDACPILGWMAWAPDFPDELADAPPSWRLPQALADLVQPGGAPAALGPESPARFARFAAATGARFGAGSGDPLVGLGDTVPASTVEAVTDGAAEGPVALWLRTPEPVDWARVPATLDIDHVVQVGDCPTEYSFRRTLGLGVLVLPSPDASSAFVVGTFGGVPVRLPQGIYTLRLSFDPGAPDRVALRPDPEVGALPETATAQFVQPAGLAWPRPPEPEVPVPVEPPTGVPGRPPWFDPSDPVVIEILREASARRRAGLIDDAHAADFVRERLSELSPPEPDR
jgi:hypothetical protein